MGKNQWVVRHDKRWAVRGEGNQKVTSTYDTQAEAIDAGREIAQNQKSEHFIQGRDAKIRDRNSYGSDPYPPPG